MDSEFFQLQERIVGCRSCPRLNAWREQVARDKVARFRGQTYWGKPVPGFGDPAARLFVVGLAPAAHGGNRTGRAFTGDKTGDWLYRALHVAGFANQPTSEHVGDGLALTDCRVAAAVRCAPPDNKPTPEETRACRPFLEREIGLMKNLRVMVALGHFAFDTVLDCLALTGATIPRPRPRFAHGLVLELPGAPIVVASYHPSRRNTSTKLLTEEMLDAVFQTVREKLNSAK